MWNCHLDDPKNSCRQNANVERQKALYGAQFARIFKNKAI